VIQALKDLVAADQTEVAAIKRQLRQHRKERYEQLALTLMAEFNLPRDRVDCHIAEGRLRNTDFVEVCRIAERQSIASRRQLDQGVRR